MSVEITIDVIAPMPSLEVWCGTNCHNNMEIDDNASKFKENEGRGATTDDNQRIDGGVDNKSGYLRPKN